MKLDKHSSVPLYAQLKDILTERIENGDYPPGSQIPTEMTLCEELELSRPTVRQAIAELVSEGLLIIMKGKGTFVRDEPERILLDDFNAFRFSFLAGSTLEDKQFHDYEISSAMPEAFETVFRSNKSGNERGFYEVIWSELHERRPFAYCRSWIPVAMFPALAEDIRMRRRMIDITANRYALIPNRANWRIYVRPATFEEARALDLSKGAPVLVSEAAYMSRSGNVSEFSMAVLKADHCVMHFETATLKRD